MENNHFSREEAKERIIGASIKLFSEKGFDGTRVNEIAEAADVNKALIYYYFDNKEAILDQLLNQILNNVTSLSTTFVQKSIRQMIQDGRLCIMKDRLHFANEAALENFLSHIQNFNNQILDYAMNNRKLIRILMTESLKESKHKNDLIQFIKELGKAAENPIIRTIREANADFPLSNNFIFLRFFFHPISIINFAVYYETYQKICGLSESKMRTAMLNSIRTLSNSFVSGNDIILQTEA